MLIRHQYYYIDTPSTAYYGNYPTYTGRPIIILLLLCTTTTYHTDRPMYHVMYLASCVCLIAKLIAGSAFPRYYPSPFT